MGNPVSMDEGIADLEKQAESLTSEIVVLRAELDAAWRDGLMFHREADARQRYIDRLNPLVEAFRAMDRIARDKTDGLDAQQKISKIKDIANMALGAVSKIAREQDRTPLEEHVAAMAGGTP